MTDAIITPRRRLSDHLLAALGGGEIAVLFQPQVAMADGAIVGVEALARWRRPGGGGGGGGGEVGAERLLAAAERAALVAEVADAIHDTALAAAAAWPATLGGLRLSINVTAADLARAGFAASLVDRARRHGFPLARLTIEVTEHELIADLDRAAVVLDRLRASGCRVALDDFGTGYSSLAYLKALPIDAIKLDRRLTLDIEGSPRDQVVIRGIIGIARALGLATTVEGVENEDQRALLGEAGADLYQGFLCAGPLTDEALLALVAGDGTKGSRG